MQVSANFIFLIITRGERGFKVDLTRVGQQVSFPGDRIQHLYRKVMFDLFSQSGHSGVEGMIKDILSPNFAEDFLPRDDAVLVAQQIFQQLELSELQA